jgi:hypothetical protein
MRWKLHTHGVCTAFTYGRFTNDEHHDTIAYMEIIKHLLAALIALSPLPTLLIAAASSEPVPKPHDSRLSGERPDKADEDAVRISADRTLYHPGEEIHILAEVRKVGIRESPLWAQLHLLTPSGEEWILDYPRDGRWRIRLIQNSVFWRPAGGEEEKLVDLSRTGTYVFWYDYEAKGTNKQARSVSPKLEIPVQELLDAEIKRQLTPSQREDLHILLKVPATNDWNELRLANERILLAKERIQADLMRAENVALADEAAAMVVAQVEKGDLSDSMKELYTGLKQRAMHQRWNDGPPVQLAIRGDYLRPLAEMEMKSLQAGRPNNDIRVLLALCLDSKDEPLRKPLTELAIARAKLSGSYQKLFAWYLLRDLEALIGKTEAEVTAILGAPHTRQDGMEWTGEGKPYGWDDLLYSPDRMLTWDVPSNGSHVNPFISVVFDGAGKVKRVRCCNH